MAEAASPASSAASGAATGFSVGGPWGAAIGGAIGLVSGVMGSKSAKKEAARQQQLMDQQIAEQRAQAQRIERAAQERNALAQRQLRENQRTAQNIKAQREAALAAGNATLAQNLNDQIAEIDKSVAAQQKEIDATETALATARETGNLETLKAIDAAVKSATDVQDRAAAAEEAALAPAQAANEKVRKQSLQDVQAGNAALRVELNKVTGQTQPEGLAAVQSRIENQAATAEADARRAAGASGQALPGSVKLTIAMGKLKAASNAAAQMYSDWTNRKAGMVTQLVGGLSQGASTAAGLKDTTGETAAERARFYGTQRLGTVSTAGTQRVAAARDLAGQTAQDVASVGNARLGVQTAAGAAKTGAVSATGAARFGLQTGTADAMIADAQTEATNRRLIQSENANAQQSFVTGQGQVASSVGAAYGAASSQAGQNAAAMYADSSKAVGQGLQSLAQGIGGLIVKPKKDETKVTG